MTEPAPHLLIVDDDERIRDLLRKFLIRHGFLVSVARDAAHARRVLAGLDFDLIVLDVMMPGESGVDLTRSLREARNTPILLLTARGEAADRIEGLEAGADDYLPKPFAMPELVARVRALMRRPGGALGLAITCGDLSFDTVGRETRVGGRLVALGRRETALLEVLLRRQGRVVPKDSAEAAVYGFDDAASANTLEVLVHRLRKRLEGAGSAVRIHTLRGLGYLLDGGEGVDGGA